MSNLDLWNRVSKTNPAHTKEVNQRGGFTAIDAHYQVQCATEVFGPVGIGWNYVCEYKVVESVVMCELVFQYKIEGNDKWAQFGPICGCAQLLGNRVDTDAPKKAMTDALTKALSHIGFNADVFLGKFDDNKYVEQLKREFNKPEIDETAQGWIDYCKPDPTRLSEIKDVNYRNFIAQQIGLDK